MLSKMLTLSYSYVFRVKETMLAEMTQSMLFIL